MKWVCKFISSTILILTKATNLSFFFHFKLIHYTHTQTTDHRRFENNSITRASAALRRTRAAINPMRGFSVAHDCYVVRKESEAPINFIQQMPHKNYNCGKILLDFIKKRAQAMKAIYAPIIADLSLLVFRVSLLYRVENRREKPPSKTAVRKIPSRIAEKITAIFYYFYY